ncbi:TraX family protein [Lysobacter sp. TAF61]|uniref:TraX family protein n=1 Tax=Lysobacter sp. TAF61 TaxID=3233072 RepID=UPI003F9AD930
MVPWRSWAGVAFVLAAVMYFRSPGQTTGPAVVAGLGMVCAVNGNAYALFALLLVVLASHGSIQWPRLRWAFYAAYPAHLAVLALLRIG